MLVQRSLQPPSASRSPGRGRSRSPSLARHFKAGVFESGHDVGAALHAAVLDALGRVVPDQLARVGLVLQPGRRFAASM